MTTSTPQPVTSATSRHPASSRELAVDAQLCLALSTSSALVVKLYRKLLAPLGLTHPQYLILIVLLETRKAQTIGMIGTRLSLETGSMTPLIKRLAAAGFIDKRRDADDDRKTWISLTEKGLATQSHLEAVREEVVRRLPLSRAGLGSLTDELQRLNTALRPQFARDRRPTTKRV